MRRKKENELDRKQILKDFKKMSKNLIAMKEGRLLTTIASIAKKHSCSSEMVYVILKENGIKILDIRTK